MKTALITGATSMDGRTLTQQLLAQDYQVILTYRRTSNVDLQTIKDSYPATDKLTFTFMDICDPVSINLAIKSILDKTPINEFYNFASQSHVGESFSNPNATILATGQSVFNLLDAIRQLTPATKFFQACTSEQFGGNPINKPYDEISKHELRSPYSIGKELAYNWVKFFRQTYNLYTCAAFCFNHSNQFRGPNFFIQKVVTAATRIHLGLQHGLTLGNLDFWRDESLADNCTRAFQAMLQLPEPEDFVIGRGRAFSGHEFLSEAFNYFGLNYKRYVQYDASLVRPNEVVKLVANPAKAIKLLNWNPEQTSLSDHIKLMCEYQLNKLSL